MTDDQVKDATNKIKKLADVKVQSMEDVDLILRTYHQAIKGGELVMGDHDKLDELIAQAK